MKLAIKQTVNVQNPDQFSDWLAGQEMIQDATGFLYAVWEPGSRYAYAYYKCHHDPRSILPLLPAKQKYVLVS
jgi:hypothetical protein